MRRSWNPPGQEPARSNHRPSRRKGLSSAAGARAVRARIAIATILGRGQQLRKRREVVTASSREHECRIHVDADHVATRCEPQLALARQQYLPGLVFLPADQGMLPIGTEPSVGSRFASGAG
jgi:hypothetical protein